MKYPKINSLYQRNLDGDRSLIMGQFACHEFSTIKNWTIDEKIDGNNIRIILDKTHVINSVRFGGRTDDAQIPTKLLDYLQDTFTLEKMESIFKDSNYVVLFGEGYGGKIQSGGYYRSDVSFVLFDVYVSGWWLKKEDVMSLAEKLGIAHTPIISKANPYVDWSIDEIVEFVRSKPNSEFSQEKHEMEGIVARSEPQLLFRDGTPVMFKLKCKDFK